DLDPPTFAADTTDYQVAVAYNVDTINVTPSVDTPSLSISVGVDSVASGAPCLVSLATLGHGATMTVPIIVTGPVGFSRTYNLHVTRVSLSNLSVTEGDLVPVFAAATLEYDVAVAHDVGSITITPSVDSLFLSIYIGEDPVISGTGHSVSLTSGVTSMTVTVTVKMIIGGRIIASQNYTITVERANQPPVARFTANPDSGESPLPVTFDAGDSLDDGTIVLYDWDFGDGHTDSGMNVNVSNIFTTETTTTYTVTLTITDNKGATGTCTQDITVVSPLPENRPPTAQFAAEPHTGVVPLTVNFNAGGSTDTDGSITYYAWNFGDGTSEVSGLTEPVKQHTYNTPGTYTVTLTVIDDDGEIGTCTYTDIIECSPYIGIHSIWTIPIMWEEKLEKETGIDGLRLIHEFLLVGKDGTLFVSAEQGSKPGTMVIVAIDPIRQKVLWINPVVDTKGMGGRPAIGPDETVYIYDPKQNLVGLDPHTGTVIWQPKCEECVPKSHTQFLCQTETLYSYFPHPDILISPKDYLYACYKGFLVVFGPAPDRPVIRTTSSMYEGFQWTAPVISSDGIFCFLSEKQKRDEYKLTVEAVMPDGIKKWSKLIYQSVKKSVQNLHLISGKNAVYILAANLEGNSKVIALNQKNGNILWTREFPELCGNKVMLCPCPVLSPQGLLYVLLFQEDGEWLVALDTQNRGEPSWSVRVGEAVDYSPPLYFSLLLTTDNALLVGTNSKGVLQIESQTGEISPCVIPGNGRIAMSPDGTVYIVGNSRGSRVGGAWDILVKSVPNEPPRVVSLHSSNPWKPWRKSRPEIVRVEFEATIEDPLDWTNLREITKYWDFGDGQTKSSRIYLNERDGEYITHCVDAVTYDLDNLTELTFDVELTVSGGVEGCSVVSTAAKTTVCLEPPTIRSATATPEGIYVNMQDVEFKCEAAPPKALAINCPVLEYKWDFGDGNEGEESIISSVDEESETISSTSSVRHRYTEKIKIETGVYVYNPTVEVNVVGMEDFKARQTLTVEVASLPTLSVSTEQNRKREIKFNCDVEAHFSHKAPPSFSWKFYEDGNIFSKSGKNPRHDYGSTGSYDAKVNVGLTDPAASIEESFQVCVQDLRLILEPLYPDSNSEPSKVMQGGVIYRYYTLKNQSDEPIAETELAYNNPFTNTNNRINIISADNGEVVLEITTSDRNNVGTYNKEECICEIGDIIIGGITYELLENPSFPVEILPLTYSTNWVAGNGCSAKGGIGIAAGVFITGQQAGGMVVSRTLKDPLLNTNKDSLGINNNFSTEVGVGVGACLGEASLGPVEVSGPEASASVSVGTFNEFTSLFNTPDNSENVEKLKEIFFLLVGVENALSMGSSQLLIEVINLLSAAISDPTEIKEILQGVNLKIDVDASLANFDLDTGKGFTLSGLTLGSIGGSYNISAAIIDYPAGEEIGVKISLALQAEINLVIVIGYDIIGNTDTARSISLELILDKPSSTFKRAILSVSSPPNGDDEIQAIDFIIERGLILGFVDGIEQFSQILNPSDSDPDSGLVLDQYMVASILRTIINNCSEIKIPYRKIVLMDKEPKTLDIGLGVNILGNQVDLGIKPKFGKYNSFTLEEGVFVPIDRENNIAKFIKYSSYPDSDSLFSADVDSLPRMVVKLLSVIGDYLVDFWNVVSALISDTIDIIIEVGADIGGVVVGGAEVIFEAGTYLWDCISLDIEEIQKPCILPYDIKDIGKEIVTLPTDYLTMGGVGEFYHVLPIKDNFSKTFEIALKSDKEEKRVTIVSIAPLDNPFIVGGFYSLQPVDKSLVDSLSKPKTAELNLTYTDKAIKGRDTEKFFIYRFNKEINAWKVIPSIHDKYKQKLTAQITQLGEYCIGYDDTPPVFSLLDYSPGEIILTALPQLRIKCQDTGSGINPLSLVAEIDDEAVNLDFDLKLGIAQLNYDFPLDAGEHQVTISGQDTSGNSNTQRFILKIQLPPSPITLEEAIVGDDAIELRFSPSQEGTFPLKQLILRRAEPYKGKIFHTLAKLEPGTIYFEDKSIEPKTNYAYQIFAEDTQGNRSIYSNIVYAETN
ncbi:hypothetical protein CVT91_07995, partial [Candidatus Atribacteria bacterium HGW-Atribacteria-1]